MLSILDSGVPTRRASISSTGGQRRELLRVGALSTFGLGLASLPTKVQAATSADPTFGKAKNVIVCFLQGGPPQHETFDPKPEAPAEIRGEFQPIATSVPGVFFSELLPRTAAIAHKLAIVRSICTHTDLHDASAYWILTGYPYKGQNSRQIANTDWPYLGSVLRQLKPSESLPGYTSVWLPDLMRLNDNVQPAGQTGGFLGRRWDPARIIGDPSETGFHAPSLEPLMDLPPLRLTGRQRLLEQVESHFARFEGSRELSAYDEQVQEAFGVLSSGKARAAFDLSQEPREIRDAYGRTKWGQCLLLGRRLIEAGCRLVHVNWPREPGDSAVDNPMWDTHAQNADRLQDVLCPQFDVSFSALIEDMDRRGLLDETLVLAIGEFGRTPRHNGNAGRDHWGHVFSFAMAGAGIQTAQVIGASDKLGAYPVSGKMEPQELTATILHLLGIGHEAMFHDRVGRPIRATEGTPVRALLGTRPATEARATPGGNLALVPPYSEDFLLHAHFEAPATLQGMGKQRRLKGWQAHPLAGPMSASLADGVPGAEKRHACLGLRVPGNDGESKSDAGSEDRILLAQEVRNPRAGHYRFSIRAAGVADTREQFDRVFLRSFTCRLVIYGYLTEAKDPRRTREFASVEFTPSFVGEDGMEYGDFTVAATLKSQDDGAMHLSKGVGVAVSVQRRANVDAFEDGSAYLAIDRVLLEFDARPRNDEVMV